MESKNKLKSKVVHENYCKDLLFSTCLDELQTSKPVMFSVVSSIPTRSNFIFSETSLNPSMSILGKMSKMSNLCYTGKTRISDAARPDR